MKKSTLPSVMFLSTLRVESKLKSFPSKKTIVSPTRYFTSKLIKSFSTHRRTCPDTQQVLLPFIKTPIKQSIPYKSMSNWFRQTHSNLKQSNGISEIEKKLLIKLNAIDHDIECCKHHIKSKSYNIRI